MAKARGAVEHTMISANGLVSSAPCIFYGCTVVNKTTGGVKAIIFDAVATAAETSPIDVVTVAAGTNANNGTFYPQGIVAHNGLYVSAIVCTTASDYVIVYYGGL